ncbi:AGR312Wp [Eremothecium gossypii ATCC 10895]|uniref:AGR312Wp n=1 Tax=Eremothecium gossypii (strain ATCC 10895 / CBS 109.51 / FGSC 9923 / NRRL Y-1056) TaxID=284811 RepID=Q74Z91_EREGS|nr:AGR312Wp [Eremothecium gossypii ATCC 10895]AAS54802.1 AGR312Wp [Eremothecium gossypii ATCC 10895]AEY99133.1 FAGR312Wp [Eremothecium gossypii FDAG1]
MMSEDSRQRLYNQSIQNAYNALLSQKRGPRSSGFPSGSSAVAVQDEEPRLSDMSEFSDDDAQVDRAMIQDDEFDEEGGAEENDDYSRFKRSLLHDNHEDYGWLDDDDTDYTDQADKSFIQDDDDDDGSTYVYEGWSARRQGWGRWAVLGLGALFVVWILAGWGGASPASPDLYRRVNQLQTQLNHLTHEAETQRKSFRSELDSTINMVIQRFEQNIKRLLPGYTSKLESNIAQLESEMQQINQKLLMENVTLWQKELVIKLNEKLPEKIPIVMEDNSNMLLIPELHDYLSTLISQVVRESVTSLPQFKFNINDYIKEVLNNNFQFVDKQYFLTQLHESLMANKDEIWQELEPRLAHLTSPDAVPQQFSSVIMKKLMHKIYNANQHQWESDLNIATFAQGSKLLNHLCSKTHHGPVGPMYLLQDCNGCTSTYWNCDAAACSWAIRLVEPMYLIKLGYVHGKFSHNLQIMTAAPKKINVYVKLYEGTQNAPQNTKYWSRDSRFMFLGSWDYDIFDNRIRQDFELPLWFIQGKYLVRSIAFEVATNHGNNQYTSLRKFVVNAVTVQDLKLMDKFPRDWKIQVPDYSVMIDDQERIRASRIAQLHNAGSVPSFGDDELDA